MTIHLDFETRSRIDITKLGIRRYATDASTQVLCLCYAFDDEYDVCLWHRDHPWISKSTRPNELVDRIAAGERVEAHNAGFEFAIWNEVLRREFPEFDAPLDLEQMYCSAARGSCVSMPRNLGDAAIAAKLTNQKDKDGKRLIDKLSKPGRHGAWCEDELEHRRNWEYCGQDVRTEREYSGWLPEMPQRERDYWLMDQRMNLRGITLDRTAAEAALALCGAEAERLNNELCELTSGAVRKGSQRIPFRAWVNARLAELSALGFEAGQLADTKADTISFALYGVPTKAGDEARANNKPAMDEQWGRWGAAGKPVRRALEICMEVNRASVAKYRRMLDSVCPDGRLHDIMLYNGADRTGRWSGKGVQPHNFVRGYSKDMSSVWDDILTLDTTYVTLIWGEALPALAKAARGALVASPGKELYAADFNAIEARKVAWLAGCAPLLHLFQTGGDPYCQMATAIYNREITKKDKTERQMGKKAVLGLGYAMGWEKFQATVWMDEGIWLDDEFCQMVVNLYRKEMYPEIPALWKATEKAAIGAIQNGRECWAGGDALGTGAISYFVQGPFLHCRLPSGRLLAYLYPEVHQRMTWRFRATNAHGNPCMVNFPAKIGLPQWHVRQHAEHIAEKQHKRLTMDAPENFVSPHLTFMGRDTITHKWKRCHTHGGSLVENADQASSRDLLAEAMWRVDQDIRFDLLLSIHDEVIGEAPVGTCTREEFESIMSAPVGWAPGMPIAAEGWVGPRLRK